MRSYGGLAGWVSKYFNGPGGMKERTKEKKALDFATFFAADRRGCEEVREENV